MEKKKVIEESITHLPQDLVLTEILPRLPVNSLLRFKCVSKSWNALISSTQFVKSHLESNSKSDSAKSILFLSDDGLSVVRYEDAEDVDIRGPYDQPSETTLVDLDDYNSLILLVGSCNGLVCYSYREDENDLYEFHVINPASGEEEEIDFGLAEADFAEVYVGFGHVASTDDYKIVVVGVFDNSICVYVFSMRSGDDWTEIELDLNELHLAKYWGGECGVLVNETVHWVTCDDSIAGFDLGEEKFKAELQVPSVLGGMLSSYMHPGIKLSVIKGCLCAWGEHRNGVVEVWMMKEYGVWDSWTKYLNLNIKRNYDLKFEQILDVTDSGKVFILTDEESLMLSDLRHCRKRYVCVAQTLAAVKYVESLISPLSIGNEEE